MKTGEHRSPDSMRPSCVRCAWPHRGVWVAAAERALGKLMAAVPASLRERAASIRQRLFVDTTGWRATSENLAMLPIVQDAVARDRKLAIHYAQPGHAQAENPPGERIMDP